MPEFKKVILISIDNLRYDCVGYQPDKRELREYGALKYLETPTLDAIAEKSLCFTNCVSTNTYTTSAHASVFTGLYPPRHGVRAFFDTRLRPDAVTLAEVFSTNGYRTICATDVPELFEPLGLTRGFDHLVVRDDSEVFCLLEAYRNEKVFLFVHFFDVHEPYLFSECPPSKDYNADYFDLMADLYRTFNLTITDKRPHALWQNFGQATKRNINYLLRVYVAGVSKFDRGRFRLFIEALKTAGYWDQALTVIFADHGEGRCVYAQPKFFGHAGELYDNVLRVPLLFQAPGLTYKVDHSLSSLVDIFPTITAWAGIQADFPYPLDGINYQDGGRAGAYAEVWVPLKGISLTDDSEGNPRVPVTEDNAWLLWQRCVRTKRRKFLLTGKPEDLRGGASPALSDEDFIRELYRKLLARFEDEAGVRHYLRALKTGTKTREDVLSEFLGSLEYRSRPRAYLYDLESDPGEECPIAAGESPLTLIEASGLLQEMLSLEVQSITTEKVFKEGEPQKTHAGKDLAPKEERSIEVIREAYRRFGPACGVAFTGGKDSTVLLHLVRRAFGGRVPFKVIHIDTTVKFPEVYAFRDRLRREWHLDLEVFRNEEALKSIAIAQNREECCHQLKTEPLKDAIRTLGLKALFTGVRRNEQAARAKEEYFSERQDPPHTRVHPLLHFTEQEIWAYIRKYNVPYCSLYDQGYRSLGCQPCTKPAVTSGAERAGRAQDKEQIMDRLRELGYF